MREVQHAVAACFPAGMIAIVAASGVFALGALAKERQWAQRNGEGGEMLGAT
jgi:hypothetical protein